MCVCTCVRVCVCRSLDCEFPPFWARRMARTTAPTRRCLMWLPAGRRSHLSRRPETQWKKPTFFPRQNSSETTFTETTAIECFFLLLLLSSVVVYFQRKGKPSFCFVVTTLTHTIVDRTHIPNWPVRISSNSHVSLANKTSFSYLSASLL